VRPHGSLWLAAFVATGLLLPERASAQSADPRIGVWKNTTTAGNVMNYEALPGGGTRLEVDAVSASGEVTSYWG